MTRYYAHSLFTDFNYHYSPQVWKCRLEELAEFKQKEGHCDVPIDYTSPYYALGLWVREQRILFLRRNEGIPSQLDQRRVDDLEQIGFVWDIGPAEAEATTR